MAEGTIRKRLLEYLMEDDPGREPSDLDLGQSTRFNVTLFGATANTKLKKARERRKMAGEIYRPQNPVSADGVRRRPSDRQPGGGPEWRLIFALRSRILAGMEEATRGPRPPAPEPGGNGVAPERGEAGEDRAAESSRRLGDVARAEAAGLYRQIVANDFRDSFFHRPSTNAYVDDLAGLESVTLYAGGAISAEPNAPLSDTLMAAALRGRLDISARDLNDDQRERVVDALMHAYPPSHLGSIARELVRQHSDADPGDVDELEREAQNVFANELRDALQAGRDSGGFLALGLGALAFAYRRAGRRTVRILTANYDDRISEAERRVHEYFSYLEGYSVKPTRLDVLEHSDDSSVPLYRLNGHIRRRGARRDPLIVGEVDSLTGAYMARSRLIDVALAESAWLFVGSDLTEPDVLAKLATAPHPSGHPRYAILLAPELGLDDAKERARALNLAANRFLHLGVVPIFIDFPHQAPQFLIEVALRIEQGEGDYATYAERLELWWNSWAKDFGFGARRPGGSDRRERSLQEAWMAMLGKLRDTIAVRHLEIPVSEGASAEKIQLEVWVRHPDERSLVLWASSDGVWLNPDSAPRCSIHEGAGAPVQRAFREGTPHHGPVEPSREQWRYQLSIPLVLRKRPWYHLPVGVVNVLSSEAPARRDEQAGGTNGEEGRLGAFPRRETFARDLARLTGTIKKPINELLDSNSPRCRREGLGEPPDQG